MTTTYKLDRDLNIKSIRTNARMAMADHIYAASEPMTQEQKDNIRFAIRWADGHKLYGVKHVKGDAWPKNIKPVTVFNSGTDAESDIPRLDRQELREKARLDEAERIEEEREVTREMEKEE